MTRRFGRRPVAPPDASAGADRTSTTGCYVWARDRWPRSRPAYLWGVLHAARLASALGLASVSAVEFGVAGGNGLIALEWAADAAERLFPVRVDVFGFDIGTGMPPPQDARDLPWAIEPGILPMDEPELRARLRRAELVIGRVEDTLGGWLSREPPPVGFAAFDLDLYTATRAALTVFEAPAERLLPRVACYFDDIFGYGWSDFAGERAAIIDFNDTHGHRKIGPLHGLKYELPAEEYHRAWPEQIYLAHIFDSARYSTLEATLPEAWRAAHRLLPPEAQ
ncbi:MAG TPA: hypothetical protein VNG13_02015 [Mycobacteriales bacterium]|nr:hypothetical protein [Mycobacteriales bacterium]